MLYDFEGNIENILTLDVNERSITEAEVLRAVKYLKNQAEQMVSSRSY